MKPQLPDGYRVKYQHTRVVKGFEGPPEAKGGKTEAFVYDSEGNLVAEGISITHPKDNFNKRIGRDISLGRALKTL